MGFVRWVLRLASPMVSVAVIEGVIEVFGEPAIAPSLEVELNSSFFISIRGLRYTRRIASVQTAVARESSF